MRRSVTVALSCLILAGCGGGVDQRKFERLKVGMNTQDVEAVLGKGGKDISPDEVASLIREALTPKAGPDGRAPAGPKLDLPDLSGARGIRWGDDSKSITVVFTNDRVTRIFKKGF